MCVCVCRYVCESVGVCAYAGMCARVYVCVCVCAGMYARVHVCMRVQVCVRECMCVSLCDTYTQKAIEPLVSLKHVCMRVCVRVSLCDTYTHTSQDRCERTAPVEKAKVARLSKIILGNTSAALEKKNLKSKRYIPVL